MCERSRICMQVNLCAYACSLNHIQPWAWSLTARAVQCALQWVERNNVEDISSVASLTDPSQGRVVFTQCVVHCSCMHAAVLGSITAMLFSLKWKDSVWEVGYEDDQLIVDIWCQWRKSHFQWRLARGTFCFSCVPCSVDMGCFQNLFLKWVLLPNIYAFKMILIPTWMHACRQGGSLRSDVMDRMGVWRWRNRNIFPRINVHFKEGAYSKSKYRGAFWLLERLHSQV